MWMLLQNEKSFSRDVALTGLLAAFSIILSYIEYLLPINIAIPGIKPGIANVAIVVALYILDYKKAIIIDVIKLIVIGILFGNAFSIMFSVAGVYYEKYNYCILFTVFNNRRCFGGNNCRNYLCCSYKDYDESQ